ncbi:MAG: hypothetical protein ACJATT_002716, partial [Myxococcota bacterium]
SHNARLLPAHANAAHRDVRFDSYAGEGNPVLRPRVGESVANVERGGVQAVDTRTHTPVVVCGAFVITDPTLCGAGPVNGDDVGELDNEPLPCPRPDWNIFRLVDAVSTRGLIALGRGLGH